MKRKDLAPIRRLIPFARPYLGWYAAVIVFTFAAAGAEGGQATLLQPLLNRVLLRGTASDGEGEDQAWAEAAGASVGAAAAEVRRGLAAAEAAPVGSLTPFAGRTAPAAWRDDPLCQLLDRTRRVLLEVEADLAEEVEAGEASAPALERVGEALLRARRLQAAAQARVLPDPLAAADADRAVAGILSLEARDVARDASFGLAWTTLSLILVVAMGLALVLGVTRYLSTALTRVAVIRMCRDMQNHATERLLTLSAGQLKDTRRGDLLSRVTVDLGRTAIGVLAPLSHLLVLEPLRLVALLVVAFVLSPPLALGLLSLGVLVLLPVRWWGKLIRRSAARRQTALGDVLEAMHQMFAGIRVVKVFRREEHEHQRFRERTHEAYRAEVAVARARTTSRTWIRLVNDLSAPLVFAGGGYLVVRHLAGLDAGRFAAFTALLVFMYRPMKQLAMSYNTLQDSIPSLVRFLEVIDLRPAIVDAPDAPPLPPLAREIRFDEVSFSYDGETEVLKDVSFAAPVGTTTAIVGHTGSGKSTLLDLLARALDPTRGRVLVDDQDLAQVQLASWLGQLALVSQDGFLFNDTVRENIRYGRLDATDAEVEEAARQAGIHEEIVAQPGGYDYVVGELGSMLSGGQRQRVTIARAIIRAPHVLLLDEAMSALDTQTEHAVQAALDRLMEGRTSFAIAHRLSTVRHADQILVLEKGRLVERGTHEELLAKGERYAELVHHMLDDPAGAGSSGDGAAAAASPP